MYFSAGLIPKYLLFRALGLTGTFWVYIFPTAMTAFTMIIMRTYVETIPKELEESAFIDGANEFVIFFKIIMPLCIPVIAAMGLFACVWHWNSYTDTLIYNLGKEHLYTLQFVLVNFVRSVATSQSPEAAKYLGITNIQSPVITPMGVRMAIIFITIIPISLVYPFLQRYFIKGILVGSIKG
jgi:putative aldouronate transport system permease protein